MGNLGTYQLMTTVAKRVGGPRNLAMIVFGGGAAVGAGVATVGKKVKNKISEIYLGKKQELEAAIVYEVTENGTSNEGLEFCIGEEFKVLEVDGNAALIEKQNELDVPYFVGVDFLKLISDYE